MCDLQVSDAILDACLEQDPDSRVRTLLGMTLQASCAVSGRMYFFTDHTFPVLAQPGSRDVVAYVHVSALEQSLRVVTRSAVARAPPPPRHGCRLALFVVMESRTPFVSVHWLAVRPDAPKRRGQALLSTGCL